MNNTTHHAPVANWISVDERVPLPRQDVIVAAFEADAEENAIVDIGFYSRTSGRWCLTGVTDISLDVRYWQPLPTPPKLQGPTDQNRDETNGEFNQSHGLAYQLGYRRRFFCAGRL